MIGRFGVGGKGGASALFIDDATVEENENEDSADASMVYGGLDVNFKVASGNLPRVKVLNQRGTNVYSVLKYEKLFLTLAAVTALEERLER